MFARRLRRMLLSHAHWLIFGIVAIVIFIGIGAFYGMTTYMTRITAMVSQNEKHIDHLKAGISQDDVRRRNILATEKIIEKVNPSISYDVRFEYATFFVDEIERMHDVDLSLALAIATAESKFEKRATTYIMVGLDSVPNAAGIFQIVPGTGRGIARDIGIPYSDSMRYDPRTNIKMGIYYIQSLLSTYHNNTEMALAHYANGGNAAESWNYNRIYSSSSEFKSMSIDQVVEELDKRTGFMSTDTGTLKNFTGDSKVSKLIAIMKAKELPVQAREYVPKVMRIRHSYIEFFKNAEVYFTPTNRDVKEKSND